MGSSSTATGNYYNPSMAAKQKMMFNNESFDMEFMMPPDVMSIDSDISKYLLSRFMLFLDKIGALTPSPFPGDPFSGTDKSWIYSTPGYNNAQMMTQNGSGFGSYNNN